VKRHQLVYSLLAKEMEGGMDYKYVHMSVCLLFVSRRPFLCVGRCCSVCLASVRACGTNSKYSLAVSTPSGIHALEIKAKTPEEDAKS
jgi:acid stress-induced BolA-like protein IbaG/YrbA